MPDVRASKDIFGSSPTLLSPVSGDKGSIMDKDATRTIAEIMRTEEEMGREKRKRLLRILWKHSKYFTLWDFYLQFHLVNHEGFKPYARHFKT